VTRRLYSDGLPPAGGRVTLSAEAARHARVLRLSRGDAVRLFDGRGGEADATVVSLSGDELVCDTSTRESVALGGGPPVALILGLPKGSKLDAIVRSTTELGVSSIHLAICERSVARPDRRRASARVDRLERIAREAARQSRRASVPPIVAPAPVAEVARRPAAGDTRVVFWEEADTPLEAELGERAPVWVVIGPEGGLSAAEVERLTGLGYASRSLGPSALRVETAAPVAVALCLDRLTVRGRRDHGA